MRDKLKIWSLLLITLFVAGWFFYDENPAFLAKRIAHAGGGLNGRTYTNSYEAMNYNLAQGFEYFEIDFSMTSDDQLVCIHDWDNSFAVLSGAKSEERPSLDGFVTLIKDLDHYEPCTLDGLAVWMKENPAAKIITDMKEKNVFGLEMIMNKLPQARERVIPQVYQPRNFDRVKKIGFNSLIWTLYHYKGTDQQILRWVEGFDSTFAVTMPRQRAQTALPSMLAKQGIPTYVHTINDATEAQIFMDDFNVSEIYTDFLVPVESR